MKKIYVAVLFLIFAKTSFSQSQLLGGNAYLQGDYVEVGINQCGGFGTTNIAPASFHARSGINTVNTGDNARNLGFIADPAKDGWTVGTPNYFNGDYFMPASPFVGWTITSSGTTNAYERTVSGSAGCNNNGGFTNVTGNMVSVSSNASQAVAVWQGTMNGILVEKTVTVKMNSVYFTVKVKLKNTIGVARTNIFYGDYVNPDNDFYNNNVQSGNLNTRNSIVFQNPANGQSLVQSLGEINQTYLALGSKDCRSKVFRGTGGGNNLTTASNMWYAGTGGTTIAGAETVYTNNCLGIAFSLGTLAANDSTSFTYAYILKASDFNEALAQTDPGFSYAGTDYNSNDTLRACTGSALNVNLTNAEGYAWSWLPATNITPAAGPNVTITAGAAAQQYIATGTGPCGIIKDTVNILPYSARLYVDSSVAITGTGASWLSPLKTLSEALDIANNNTCGDEIWVKKGTYFPMINTYLSKAASRDSAFRILRNNIKVYGGFAGTETLLSQRVAGANTTRLSGDLNILNDSTDNCYHVMTIVGKTTTNIDVNTVVDGFTITGGNCNGTGAPLINGLAVFQSAGGGIIAAGMGAGNESSPRIENCIFDKNAGAEGAGFYAAAHNGGKSRGIITGCTFNNNRAAGNGGGMQAYSDGTAGIASPVVSNTIFTNNFSDADGGACKSLAGGTSVSNMVFTGCTFTNNSTSNNAYAWGGAIASETRATAVMTNCTFTNNRSAFGGAFSSGFGSLGLTISNSVFTGNIAANYGGAIDAYVIPANSIINTTFTRNVAGAGTTGGALNLDNAPATVTDCSFTENKAGYGGGINAVGPGTIILNNPIFTRDSASVNGGGLRAVTVSAVTVNNARFLNNYAVLGGGSENAGTGLLTFINTVFSANRATQNGGAHNNTSGATSFTNCVMAFNQTSTVSGNGGGAIRNSAGTITLNNSTLSGNSTTSAAQPNGNSIRTETGAVTVLNNSIVWGTAPNQISNAGTGTNNYSDIKGVAAAGTNISRDPLFINAADPDGADNIWSNGDDGLRLIDCSPSINTGSNALIPAGITTDITSGPRIIQAIVDMGAYEIPYVIPPTQSVTIAITAGAQTICPGTSVTFTATPANGGTTPSYQWQVNGINAGTNSNTFTSATLANNDAVTVIMTSNLVCFIPATASSAGITMTVTPFVAPSVAIAITSGTQTICAGTSVTFIATPTNGGATPTYQWLVNGNPAGTNSNIFTSAVLTNNAAVTVVMTSSSACAVPATATSAPITITVTPNVVPSVTIAITNGAQIICSGTSVTFTATAVNGGASPGFQWQINGINAGINSTTFSSTTLANGDVVSVILTSNAACAVPATVTSNAINMTVTPNVTPAVTIAITNGSQTICPGTSVTFTATPTNGGATPAYQWQINGINAGTNSNTFTSATLANADVVTVILTSNAGCLITNNAVSNPISITVTTSVSPSVTIAITAGAQTICPGMSVTFTATPTNGGTAPAYQWQVNGTNAGTNSNTFTSSTLNNGDAVTVILTSNAGCLTTANATSTGITMTVTAGVTPSVSIAITAGSQNICAGTSITFTATPTNGGTAPVYQWQVNGSNAGTNSSTFTSTTLANADVVTVVLTSNAACATPASFTSNPINMMVTPNVTPAVNIAITNGTQVICSGTSVTFTATPTNGGTAPAYQWQVNGINAGTNSNTFTSATLANADVVTVILTANAGCLTTNTAISNPITMTVTTTVIPSVSIAITTGAQTICPGTSVTFTATPTNGGTAPAYQWQVNGNNTGTNSNTFTSSTLNNGDAVTVILTSNAGCLTTANATSTGITMTVTSGVTPSVSIAITAGSQNICAGTSVTFTATPTNGGTAPVYQWQVNGNNAGTNSNTFTSNSFSNGDVVTVILTSNAGCLIGNNVTSNPINISVSNNVVPAASIAITSGAQTICAGTSVTFTATPVNGGTSPVYQWQVNGINAGTNGNTFTSTTLNNGDAVSVILTSNAACAVPVTGTSNALTITVNPNLTPSVSIAITTGAQTICAGTSVTFTATPTNGGTAPAYQWQVNNINAGTNSNAFTSSTLANGDVITVVLTSNEGCLTGNNVAGNAIAMTVTTNVSPAVSIAITGGAQAICPGTSVTFTASPINGGTLPAYQWQVNGINVGTNSNTFSSSTFVNGDVVTAIMTSNLNCVTANNVTSNPINITVNTNVTPVVSISITSGAQTICAGTSVTFTAMPTYGGSAPAYQWQVNGINAGTNSNTFTSTTLANADAVTVILTSNEGCVTVNTATSNAISMTVNANLTPSVSIAITVGSQSICSGTAVTFTAATTNGGTAPSYQWQVNGINAGTNNSTFTSTTLNDADAVTVAVTSNAACLAANNVTSNVINMTVTTTLTPSVSIAVTGGAQIICAGTSVTFTATPTNGGSTPGFQWQVNGVNAGTGGNTFTSSTLSNADAVTVILTSNAACVSVNNVASNSITMTVNTNLTSAVSVAITTGTQTICAGTSVTFTATPSNGGSTPGYQWQVNGINSGTNSNTFTSATLNTGDAVTVILTSNAGCVTTNNATSSAITMTVNPNLTPTATIAITNGTQTICAGTSVTFTASPVNGGGTPAYQWQVNGINAGTNSNTFTSAILNNADAVTVILSSNAACLTANNVTSNSITMTVNPNLTPSVTIAITAGTQTICAGTSVTFTATPVNGGTAPSYQWKVNGINAGTNSNVFTSATLANNDAVTVVLTSIETCLASNNVTSNAIAMTVNPNLTPTVSIAITGGAQTICAGTAVTFTATATNGGTTPGYQWKVNGVNAGGGNNTFSTIALNNGDAVTVVLTSNAGCLATNNVTSNAITMAVNPNLTPSVSISTPANHICVNDPATFTALPVNGGSSPFYQWRVNGISIGSNSPVFTYAGFNTGDIVTVMLVSNVTCPTVNNVLSNAVMMTVAETPVLTLTADNPEILIGGATTLHVASTEPIGVYSWTPSFSLNNPGSDNPIATPDATTAYRLDATSIAGCRGTAFITIKVGKGPQIANTFTPNGDGIHDVWEIKNLETYPDCRIQVFTRAGQLVFESIGYRKPWDGYFRGKLLPVDTYYYIIEMNNRVKAKPVTGYITIMR